MHNRSDFAHNCWERWVLVLALMAGLWAWGAAEAFATPWAVPGEGANVKATPYPAGQTRTYGFPVQFGDNHVCADGGLSIYAELADGNGAGGAVPAELRIGSPLGETSSENDPVPGGSPMWGAGIAAFQASQKDLASGQLRASIRVRGNGCNGRPYQMERLFKFTIVLDPKGPAPKVPPLIQDAPPQSSQTPGPTRRTKSASRRRFARSAVLLARGIVPLVRRIKQQSANPSRLKTLVSSLRQRADRTANTFDLEKLAKPSVWKQCVRGAMSSASDQARAAKPAGQFVPLVAAGELGRAAQNRGPQCSGGARLRKDQIKALPEFASKLNKFREYDKVMLDKTDTKYAADADFRFNVDTVTALDPKFTGRTYAQLTPEERTQIASQFQPQSGAQSVLLQWAREVGKAATRVVFGK